MRICITVSLKKRKAYKEKQTKLSVSRKEVKYLLSLQDRLFLLDALDHILTPDAYGGYDGYTVRSVYFDSITNEDYIDKKRGADEKKRIRVRIYHTEDATERIKGKLSNIQRRCAAAFKERFYSAFKL